MKNNIENGKIINTIESCIREIINGQNPISVKESLKETDINKKYIYNEISFQHELGIALRDKLSKLGDQYTVQLERNIDTFKDIDVIVKSYIVADVKKQSEFNKLDKKGKRKMLKDERRKLFKKSRIDIVVVNTNDPKERYAIELKYHYKSMGEIPNYMYKCIEDVLFAEVLYHELEFKFTVCVTVVEDEIFFRKRDQNVMRSNYKYFEYYKNENERKKLIEEIRNKGIPDVVHDKKENIKIRGKELLDEKSSILPVKWETIDSKLEAKYYIVTFPNNKKTEV